MTKILHLRRMQIIKKSALLRYVGGLLFGLLIAIAMIDWSPAQSMTMGGQTGYLVKELNVPLTYTAAPITWPALVVQHFTIFGCSSDSEELGCFTPIDTIYNGRIYIMVLLSLLSGLFAVYLPDMKHVIRNGATHISLLVLNIIGVIFPYILFYPYILQHNQASWSNAIFMLLMLYVPVGLMFVYRKIKKRSGLADKKIKLIGVGMIVVYYLLSVWWVLYLLMANSF